MGFKKDFQWGAATASYQIEGAAREDGKGASIWDEFCRIPGKIAGGQTGDVACDHYHRFREDIALMKKTGFTAYRFSISWPRVMPHGTGEINEAGFAFYEALVDELLANGITPYATLYHWDYPAELQKKGGWLNPESPKWFEEYAAAVAKRFRGKIRHYFTVNEPQCFIGLGYLRGEHAPGLRYPTADVLACVHHVLLAHGLAVRALRAHGGENLQIGLAQCGKVYIPFSGSAADVEAARKATFAISDSPDDLMFNVSLWSDPIFRGDYPEQFYSRYADFLPDIKDGDRKIIGESVDFYAQNIYSATPVKAGRGGFETVDFPVGTARNSIGWEIAPQSLYWCAKFLYEAYGKPVIISENGMAAHDAVSLDGMVHDPNRIDYLHRHLLWLRKAAEEGVDVDAYFQWSLLDNFEWTSGYGVRFGMIYMDYQTQRRIPKDSASWYRSVIQSKGESM